jgi:hypothetical protein
MAPANRKESSSPPIGMPGLNIYHGRSQESIAIEHDDIDCPVPPHISNDYGSDASSEEGSRSPSIEQEFEHPYNTVPASGPDRYSMTTPIQSIQPIQPIEFPFPVSIDSPMRPPPVLRHSPTPGRRPRSTNTPRGPFPRTSRGLNQHWVTPAGASAGFHCTFITNGQQCPERHQFFAVPSKMRSASLPTPLPTPLFNP